MAELLIRVVDKTSADPYKDVKLTKRGDVIMVQEDGWNWSEIEKTHPEWRILKWPTVTVSEASLFMSPELPTEPKASEDMPDDPMLQRRGFKIDIDAPSMPRGLKAYFADATRAVPFALFPARFDVAGLRKQKPKRANPAVIG